LTDKLVADLIAEGVSETAITDQHRESEHLAVPLWAGGARRAVH
jgi:hypothetical protein